MKSKLKKDFGNRIKYFRNRQGFTQEQLAEMIDLQPNSLGYVENGKNSLSFDRFEKLIKALNVEAYQMFLFDNRDEANINKINEIVNIAKTLNKRDLDLAYRIIFEIGSNKPKKS